MVRLLVVEFPGNKVFCLRGSAICTVVLLLGLCASFKTSNNFTVHLKLFTTIHHQTFDCPVGVWVIEQHAIILNATVRSPTVRSQYIVKQDCFLQKEARVCVSDAIVVEDSKFKLCFFVVEDEQVIEEADVLMWI